MTTAITKTAGDFFTEEQRKMILNSFLNGATPAEAAVLLELARIRRLNPITQQIHFVKRWNAQRKTETWAAQVGIDGFRAIAERTGLYDGQDEAEFEYDAKGSMKLCRVRVYRKDWSRPAVGVAHYSEYVQLKKEGGATHMWASKPHIMLAKCAEACAFRKAFPEDTAGLYAPEEGVRDDIPDAPDQQQTALPETGKRTADIKARLAARVAREVPAPKAARLSVVDVLPGESEQQAEQRQTAQPWPMVQALLSRHGKTGFQLAAYIKEKTGKERKEQLTMQDFETLCEALEGPSIPPPTDDDAPNALFPGVE